nr:unnamed protein product [Digitaria exilis]
MFVINKAALDHGMNSYIFIFYRQALASLFLLPIAVLLERITATMNLYNVGLMLTSPTVSSATGNSIIVFTFCLAWLLRMEEVKLRSRSGIAKLAGVALSIAGVLVIALYTGPLLSPLNHHSAFRGATISSTAVHHPSRAVWIKGAAVLKEFPNKLLVTVTQSVFSVGQSFVVAVIAERDFSKWKLRPDIGLLAIGYSGLVVFGVSYYLQAWCVEMKGPVFLAAWAPVGLILTIFCSSFFLGDMRALGQKQGH